MSKSVLPKVLVIEDNCDAEILKMAFEAYGFEIELVEFLPPHKFDPFYDDLVKRLQEDEFEFIVCDGSVRGEGSSVVETYEHLIPLIRPHVGLIVANSNSAENRNKQMEAQCDIEGIMTVDGKKNWLALAAELERIFNEGRDPSVQNTVAQAA